MLRDAGRWTALPEERPGCRIVVRHDGKKEGLIPCSAEPVVDFFCPSWSRPLSRNKGFVLQENPLEATDDIFCTFIDHGRRGQT